MLGWSNRLHIPSSRFIFWSHIKGQFSVEKGISTHSQEHVFISGVKVGRKNNGLDCDLKMEILAFFKPVTGANIPTSAFSGHKQRHTVPKEPVPMIRFISC